MGVATKTKTFPFLSFFSFYPTQSALSIQMALFSFSSTVSTVYCLPMFSVSISDQTSFDLFQFPSPLNHTKTRFFGQLILPNIFSLNLNLASQPAGTII
jgi:hypothetical protein